jgi:hypothetical protein
MQEEKEREEKEQREMQQRDDQGEGAARDVFLRCSGAEFELVRKEQQERQQRQEQEQREKQQRRKPSFGRESSSVLWRRATSPRSSDWWPRVRAPTLLTATAAGARGG